MTTEIRIVLYALLVAAIFVAGTAFGINLWYKPEHEAHLKDNATAAAFKAQTELDGLQRIKDDKAKDDAYALKLKTANSLADDANHKLADWMRKHPAGSPGSSSLPPDTGKPAGTDRSGQICFDRTELDNALRLYESDVEQFLAQGQQAINDRQELIGAWPQ